MSDGVMLAVTVAAAALYAIGAARLRARVENTPMLWKTVSACMAFGVLVVLELPLFHHLAEDLFTFHMVNHVLLASIAAPFLILAQPAAPLLWSLPRAARSVSGRLISRVIAWKPLILARRPLAATAIHALALWAWHVPWLYNLAVRDELAHWLQHASFFVTALLFWSAVFRKPNAGIAVLMLLVTIMHTGMLGALLTFSPAPWYLGHDPGHWGLTALEDQQLAGLVMWVPASFIYLAAAMALGATLLEEPVSGPPWRVP
jgi:cytochrome c oxidase assembly factor CtaG